MLQVATCREVHGYRRLVVVLSQCVLLNENHVEHKITNRYHNRRLNATTPGGGVGASVCLANRKADTVQKEFVHNLVAKGERCLALL